MYGYQLLLLDMNAFFKSLLFSMMAVEYVTKTTNFFDNFNFSHGRQTLVLYILNSFLHISIEIPGRSGHHLGQPVRGFGVGLLDGALPPT